MLNHMAGKKLHGHPIKNIRGVLNLFLFSVCNFGYGWEYGSVKAVTQYKSFVNEQVQAEIGLKVGLRGINVTLRGEYHITIFYFHFLSPFRRCFKKYVNWLSVMAQE